MKYAATTTPSFGDDGVPYRYSGTVTANPWTPTLLTIRGRSSGHLSLRESHEFQLLSPEPLS
jgi:hypothetical protein